MMVDHSTVTLFTVQITRRHLPASFIPKSADVMGYLAEPGAKRGLVAPTCCSGGPTSWAPPSLCCERERVPSCRLSCLGHLLLTSATRALSTRQVADMSWRQPNQRGWRIASQREVRFLNCKWEPNLTCLKGQQILATSHPLQMHIPAEGKRAMMWQSNRRLDKKPDCLKQLCIAKFAKW